ncbi:MAG TPA: protein translocase subunit SecF [Candidatus Nanoarchaeia archaeon]|nr:protein translocase subunit SecF [Candidatus Nanoarchaeia archaeon]
MFKEKVIHFYDKNYKKLLILPMLLLVLSIAQIAYQVYSTGDFINKGTSLKGGSVISISTETDVAVIREFLDERFPGQGINVRSITDTGRQIGVTIDTPAQTDEEITPILAALRERVQFGDDDITVEITGSSLGSSFFRQTFTALIIAFILMSLVVFLYFRMFVPSIAVVLAGFSDLVETVAIFNLTGYELSTAGIAAFLMLIGYFVDANILLTSRVLKRREGTFLDRFKGAFTTGMTMITATFAAVIAALIFTNSPVVREIMVILSIGLVVDVINTWVQNAAILRIYLEKDSTHKDAHHSHGGHHE